MVLREPINGLTHLAGAGLAFIGTIYLVRQAFLLATPWHVVAFLIFGLGLILLYLSSGLYHSLPLTARGTRALQRLDHIMIYVLIAGTYTPICLVPLRGSWGWSLFGAIWALAAAGIALVLSPARLPRWLTVMSYVLLGWLCLVAIVPIIKNVSMGGLVWLALGGLFYSVGAVIYTVKRPNPAPGVFGFHEIWHLFVLAGSFSHYWLMLRYILPLRGGL